MLIWKTYKNLEYDFFRFILFEILNFPKSNFHEKTTTNSISVYH